MEKLQPSKNMLLQHNEYLFNPNNIHFVAIGFLLILAIGLWYSFEPKEGRISSKLQCIRYALVLSLAYPISYIFLNWLEGGTHV